MCGREGRITSFTILRFIAMLKSIILLLFHYTVYLNYITLECVHAYSNNIHYYYYTLLIRDVVGRVATLVPNHARKSTSNQYRKMHRLRLLKCEFEMSIALWSHNSGNRCLMKRHVLNLTWFVFIIHTSVISEQSVHITLWTKCYNRGNLTANKFVEYDRWQSLS